jgi:hypothetical protein
VSNYGLRGSACCGRINFFIPNPSPAGRGAASTRLAGVQQQLTLRSSAVPDTATRNGASDAAVSVADLIAWASDAGVVAATVSTEEVEPW